jgi:hypothetical protein
MRRLFLLTVLAFAFNVAPASADVNCSSFSSQAAAQYYFNAHPGDPDGLDGNDHDGIACESNPCPCYYGTASAQPHHRHRQTPTATACPTPATSARRSLPRHRTVARHRPTLTGTG